MKRIFPKQGLALLAAAGLLSCLLALPAPQASAGTLDGLNLTPDQITALSGVIKELSAKQADVNIMISARLNELAAELQKDDLVTEHQQKKHDKRIDKMVLDIAALYGDLLRNRVEYLLQAKDILTPEQKETLISSIRMDMELEDFLPQTMDQDYVELQVDLDLTREQVKKILKIDTKRQIKELKIEEDVANVVLDLQEELSNPDRNPEKVNKLILKATDLANDFALNRVDALLKVKDVLTIPQRQLWLHRDMFAAVVVY